jgi:hypothetical protein
MDSSRGFGSTARDYTPTSDSLSLRLPHSALTLPRTITRRLIKQKARHSPWVAPETLTACKHTVSGSFSLPVTGVLFTFPSRYWFTIGRVTVFSLGRWASQFPTSLPVARGTRGQHAFATPGFGYGTLTRSGRPFQDRSPLLTSRTWNPCAPPVLPHNPICTTNTVSHAQIVWTLPLSLAATPGISFDVSSSGY